MPKQYFTTPRHFANFIAKTARERQGTFEPEKLMSLESYVDMAYSAGLGDEFGRAVLDNPKMLEEDNFLRWLQLEKSGGFAFPSTIELVTTNEFRNCLSSLVKRPGCYTFWNGSDLPLYAGYSVDLASRIVASFEQRFRHYSSVVYLRYMVTATASDAALCEVAMIAKHKPALNGTSKFNDELTIDVKLPSLSERIQCNVEGPKVWLNNGGYDGMLIPESLADDGVELTKLRRVCVK